jgi:hypothetical protein
MATNNRSLNRLLKARDAINTRKLLPPGSRPTLDRNDSEQAILKGKRDIVNTCESV